MYLSNRDLEWAVDSSQLIVEPKPTVYDESSIDLHLDALNEAKVWDLNKWKADHAEDGDREPTIRIGKFKYPKFSAKFLAPIPEDNGQPNLTVYQKGGAVFVRPHGFLLWQTRESVGTPQEKAQYICFVDGKSTRARTGIVVHLTAPTIHAAWSGQITLEIANLGPWTLELHPGDAIAQITVARLTNQQIIDNVSSKLNISP